MERIKVQLSNEDIEKLNKLSSVNNMSSDEIIDLLLFLWNEFGDVSLQSITKIINDYSYNFNGIEKVEYENDEYVFYAEVIPDEFILK